MSRKRVTELLIILLIGGLALTGTLSLGAGQTGTSVAGILPSNTTWTKANSPYQLTGPTAVDIGGTLTIEPGVIVNFNGFYIRVNGTLIVTGAPSEKVYFNGGQITITLVANGWNQQSGSGCNLDYAYLNRTSISSEVSLKIADSYSNASITVGSSSILANNLLINETTVGDSSTITGNIIVDKITAGNYAEITNNSINGSVTSGSATIVNNTITGTMTITNPVSAFSSISNNTLSGGGAVWEFVIVAPIPRNAAYPRSVINVAGGTAEISNNTITSQDISTQEYDVKVPKSNYDGGYGITTQANCNASIHGNTISGGFVRAINIVGPGLIQNNLIFGNSGGIAVGKKAYNYGMLISQGDVTIRDNILANSEVGIGGFVINSYYGLADYDGTPKARTVTIERNFIAGSTSGIDFALKLATLSLQNNTITNSSFAIALTSCPSATINYNNIQNYTQRSINLTSTSVDVNATYNWWGTTNLQAINQSIYDFKNDFNLGNVNFTPFLTSPNTQAPATPNLNSNPTPTPTVPEYPTFAILPLVMAITLLTVLFMGKRKGPLNS